MKTPGSWYHSISTLRTSWCSRKLGKKSRSSTPLTGSWRTTSWGDCRWGVCWLSWNSGDFERFSSTTPLKTSIRRSLSKRNWLLPLFRFTSTSLPIVGKWATTRTNSKVLKLCLFQHSFVEARVSAGSGAVRHGEEQNYIFNRWYSDEIPDNSDLSKFPEADAQVRSRFLTLFTNFAKELWVSPSLDFWLHSVFSAIPLLVQKRCCKTSAGQDCNQMIGCIWKLGKTWWCTPLCPKPPCTASGRAFTTLTRESLWILTKGQWNSHYCITCVICYCY